MNIWEEHRTLPTVDRNSECIFAAINLQWHLYACIFPDIHITLLTVNFMYWKCKTGGHYRKKPLCVPQRKMCEY